MTYAARVASKGSRGLFGGGRETSKLLSTVMTSFTNGPTTTVDVDDDDEGPSSKKGLWKKIAHHLNFYRVHLLFLWVQILKSYSTVGWDQNLITNTCCSSTFTPIFFSIIFYASNGRYKISYIDSLFNCVSAMMVCGLATVDLSSLTPFQQALLFIQMCIGNQV